MTAKTDIIDFMNDLKVIERKHNVQLVVVGKEEEICIRTRDQRNFNLHDILLRDTEE